MRLLLATALTGVALLAAGCGGGSSYSSSSSASAQTPDTASLAPKDAGLWISVDTDRGSSQWKALDAVLAQIPGAENLLNDALAQIGNGDRKLDFQADVLPALGREVVAVLPSGSSDPVVIVKPTDDAKFKALLASSTKPPVTGQREGWTVVAQTQKALDAYTAAFNAGTLADEDAFAQAMDGLPTEALARAFVDGKGLGAALARTAGAAGGALQSIPGLGSAAGASASVNPKAAEQLGTIGLAVSAGDHVLRFDGSVEPTSGIQAVSFEPALLDKVPADAMIAVTWAGDAALTKQISTAVAQAGEADALTSVEKQLGVSLDDLLGLADGEGVLYVRPGLIIPEITVVLRPEDPAKAQQTIDTVVAKLSATTSGKVTETTQAGVRLKQVTVSVLSVAWGRDGDRIVVTTSPRGIEEFDGSGAKLVTSDRFKLAAADMGLGDKTSGLVYVDVKAFGPLVSTIAGLAGSGSDTTLTKLSGVLSAIDSVGLNSTVDGSRVRFHGVLRVA